MSTKNRVEFLVLRKNSEGEIVEEWSAGVLDDDCRDLINIEKPSASFYIHNDTDLAAKIPGVGSIIQAWVTTPTEITPRLLYTNKAVSLGEGYYTKVKIHPTPLERREKTATHCGECTLFSAERGVELLMQETHTFADGEKGYMNQAIVDAMAETYGRPTLTKENVGYCPKCKGLVGKESPTCEGYEPK